jgi:hypothetical protein
MNGLYPIIRRVRRPLLPIEVLADAVFPDGHQAGANPAPVATPEQKAVGPGKAEPEEASEHDSDQKSD